MGLKVSFIPETLQNNNNFKFKNMNPVLNTSLISRKQFESILFNRFGLKLDMNKITKYLDTYSCNRHAYSVENPKVFTIDFIDSTGFGWANIYSEFYNKHTKPRTELFNEFKEFIGTHTFKIDNHFLI